MYHRHITIIFISSGAVWKLSYAVKTDTSQAPSTAQNTHALPVNLLKKYVQVSMVSGQKYEVLDITESIQLASTFGVVFSNRIFSSDVAPVEEAVFTTVSHTVAGICLIKTSEVLILFSVLKFIVSANCNHGYPLLVRLSNEDRAC